MVARKKSKQGSNFKKNAQLSENDNSEKDSDQITTPEQSEFLTLREDDTANELLPEYTEESESSDVDPLSLASVVMSINSRTQRNSNLLGLKVEIEDGDDQTNLTNEPLVDCVSSTEILPDYMVFNYCRLCATRVDQNVAEPVFGYDNKIGYLHKIKECIGLNIKKQDGYSTFICGNCKKLLVDFYNFRLKCKFVDSELKQRKKSIFEISHLYRDQNLVTTIANTSNTKKDKLDTITLKSKQVTTEDACKDLNNVSRISSTNIPLCYAEDIKDIALLDASADPPSCNVEGVTSFYPVDIKDEPLHPSSYLIPRHSDDIKDILASNDLTSNPASDIKSRTLKGNDSSPNLKAKHIVQRIKRQNKKPVVVKSVPGETGTKKYTYMCDICGMTVCNLRNHMLVHKSAEVKHSFKCTSCDKRFCKSIQLRQHMNIHLNVKPYVCTVCGMSFIKSGILRRHMIVHTGERKFQCYACEKRFQNGYNLKTHIRSHTGERPYKCPCCVATFAHRATLNLHVKKCTLDVNN